MTATLTTEPTVNRDGSVTWVTTGTAGGIPYVAEGDSQEDAVAAACALVYQRHALREFRRISAARSAQR